jgi:hypothetical protein
VTLTSLPAVHGAPVRHASFTVLPAKHRHGRRRG